MSEPAVQTGQHPQVVVASDKVDLAKWVTVAISILGIAGAAAVAHYRIGRLETDLDRAADVRADAAVERRDLERRLLLVEQGLVTAQRDAAVAAEAQRQLSTTLRRLERQMDALCAESPRCAPLLRER